MNVGKAKPLFFSTPVQFREWLKQHHSAESELWVGFYKKHTARPGITWPESVDEALCYGWIDGLRKSIDETSYRIRFTPRKPRSTWSAVNVRRVAALRASGRMQPAGLRAFEQRPEAAKGYSYEPREARLEGPLLDALKGHVAAWKFFETQPPYYKRLVSWWVMSAKRNETRIRRLQKLIGYSANGQRISETLPATKNQKRRSQVEPPQSTVDRRERR